MRKFAVVIALCTLVNIAIMAQNAGAQFSLIFPAAAKSACTATTTASPLGICTTTEGIDINNNDSFGYSPAVTKASLPSLLPAPQPTKFTSASCTKFTFDGVLFTLTGCTEQ